MWDSEIYSHKTGSSLGEMQPDIWYRTITKRVNVYHKSLSTVLIPAS